MTHRFACLIIRPVNNSGDEITTVIDADLLDKAMVLLPQVGKLLFVGISRVAEARGLSLAQIKAVMQLARSSHERPSTIGEVAAALAISMPAASELVDRLVEADMVERKVDPSDRRRALVALTPGAEQLAAELIELRRAQIAGALARLEPGERPVFVRSLAALVEALGESMPPPVEPAAASPQALLV